MVSFCQHKNLHWPKQSGNSSPAPSYFHLLRSPLFQDCCMAQPSPSNPEQQQDRKSDRNPLGLKRSATVIAVSELVTLRGDTLQVQRNQWKQPGRQRPPGGSARVPYDRSGSDSSWGPNGAGWPQVPLPFRTHVTAAHCGTSDASGLIWSPWEPTGSSCADLEGIWPFLPRSCPQLVTALALKIPSRAEMTNSSSSSTVTEMKWLFI